VNFLKGKKKDLQNTQGSARSEKRIEGKNVIIKDGKRESENKP
jgi:hypothetical protein